MYGPRRRSIEAGDTVIDTTNADQPVIVERLFRDSRWAIVAWRDGNGIERGELRRINVLRTIEATP